jgi:hypothetical protein
MAQANLVNDQTGKQVPLFKLEQSIRQSGVVHQLLWRKVEQFDAGACLSQLAVDGRGLALRMEGGS